MTTLLELDPAQCWRVAGWTMVHFLWIGAAIAGAAAACRVALRRAAPTVRYAGALVWFALLGASPVAIAVWFVAHDESTPFAAAPIATQAETVEVAVDPIAPPPIAARPADETPAQELRARHDPQSPTSAPSETTDHGQLTTDIKNAIEAAAGYLPWLWLIGAPLTLAAMATGLVGSERLRRGSRPVNDGPVAAAAARLTESLRLASRVTVAVSERVATPVLLGVVRPLILLPPSALTGWSPEEIEMVLVHELAHVRRWDNLANLAQRLVESLLFFHPAVWRLSAWVRQEREACCDAAVVAHTREPHAYAELLVSIAQRTPRRGRLTPVAASGIARGPLAARVRHILQLEDDPMLVSGRSLLLFAGGLLLVACIGVLSAPRAGVAQQAQGETNDPLALEDEAAEDATDEDATDKDPAAQGFPETTEDIQALFRASDENPVETRTFDLSDLDADARKMLENALDGFEKDPFGPRVDIQREWDAGTDKLKVSVPRNAMAVLDRAIKLIREKIPGRSPRVVATLPEDSSIDEVTQAIDEARGPGVEISVRRSGDQVDIVATPAQRDGGRSAVDKDSDAHARQLLRKALDGLDKDPFVRSLFVAHPPENPAEVWTYELPYSHHIGPIQSNLADLRKQALSDDASHELTLQLAYAFAENALRVEIRAPRAAHEQVFTPMFKAGNGKSHPRSGSLLGPGAPTPHYPNRSAVVTRREWVAAPESQPARSGNAFPSLSEQKLADLAWRRLRVELEPLSEADSKLIKVFGYQGGLKVTHGRQLTGPGEYGELRPNDILVGLHVWPTTGLEEVAEILRRDDLGQLSPLKFYVVRPAAKQQGGFSSGPENDEVVTGRIAVSPAPDDKQKEVSDARPTPSGSLDLGADRGASSVPAPSVPDTRGLDVALDEQGRLPPFGFRGQRWPEVMKWVANLSGHSLDWESLPSDHLDLTTQRSMSVEELRELIGSRLRTRGYTLLIEGGVMSVQRNEESDTPLRRR